MRVLPNVIGIYLLAPVVKRELAVFLARVSSGEIRPTLEAQERLIASP